MSHFRDNTLFFQFHNRVNLTWFLLRKHNYPCSGSIQVIKDLSYYNNTKNQFLTMLKVNLEMYWKFFNPYWQILENSSRNFSFPGCDADGLLENSSSIFSKFQFPGHEQGRFLENLSIIFLYLFSFCKISRWVFQKSVCHARELIKIFWMSFPESGPCHAPKF